MSEARLPPDPGVERRVRALPARARRCWQTITSRRRRSRSRRRSASSPTRPRSARRSGARTFAAGATGGRQPSSPRCSSATRPTTTRTSVSGGRSRSSATGPRRAGTCRSPAACGPTAPTTACTAIACAPLEGARTAGQPGFGVGRRRGRRRDRARARRAARRRPVGRRQAEPAGSPRRSPRCAYSTTSGADGPFAARPGRAGRRTLHQPVHALRRRAAGPQAQLHRGGRAASWRRSSTSSSAGSWRSRGCGSRRGRFGARMSVGAHQRGARDAARRAVAREPVSGLLRGAFQRMAARYTGHPNTVRRPAARRAAF